MKKTGMTLIIGAVFVGFTMTAGAALLAYEGFAYSGTNLNTQAGGTGWADWWYDGGLDFSHLTDDGTSLDSTAFPYTPVGSRIEGVGGAAERNVSNTLNFGADGVRYFSAMMSKSSTASASGESVLFMMRDSGAGHERCKFGIGSDDQFYARAGNEAATGGGTVTAGVNYFLVAKMVTTAAGADTLYLKAYAPTDTVDISEPVSWTVTNVTASGVRVNRMQLAIGGAIVGNGGAIDEIRIGKTWEEVTKPITLGIGGITNNVMEMIIDDCPSPSYFHPEKSTELVSGGWINAAHSTNGFAPFIVTNLDYSAASGSSQVIYLELEPSDDTAFFGLAPE